MHTLTIANPAHKVSAAHPAGTPATAGACAQGPEGDLDFAGLLLAGIGRTTGLEPGSDLVETAQDATASDAGDEALPSDPAALLDAIAAGNEAQQLSAAQSTLQPMPAALAAVDLALAQPANSAALQAATRDIAPGIQRRTEGGGSIAHPDAPEAGKPLRANEARHDAHAADAAPAATFAQAAVREPANVSVLKAEIAERRPEPLPQTAAVGSTPGHALGPAQPANPASFVAHVEHLAQPFGSRHWDDAFASRIVWMARNDVQSAEIRLNPPDLGPIEVKLVVTSDQGAQASATVQFSAAHAATREAIESALPRLREMLLDNGIALGNTTVDAGTAGNTQGSGDSGRSSHGGAQADADAGHKPDTAGQPRPGNPLRRGNGLVDTFA